MFRSYIHLDNKVIFIWITNFLMTCSHQGSLETLIMYCKAFDRVCREHLGEIFKKNCWKKRGRGRGLHRTLGWNEGDYPEVCREPLRCIRPFTGSIQDPLRVWWKNFFGVCPNLFLHNIPEMYLRCGVLEWGVKKGLMDCLTRWRSIWMDRA